MSLRARFLAPVGASSFAILFAATLAGQTPTPTPAPTTQASETTWTIENGRFVTGVNLTVQPDGSVWFLVPSNDRIVQLQPDGITMKQWQIRNDNNIGANPVDFYLAGNIVWFAENGQSQIDAGFSAIGRLDTTTGALREFIIPGSRPAGFYVAPDGTLWVAQSFGRVQSVNPTTLAVTDYRSGFSFAYSDAIIGPDGAMWMADFGDNRIVRWPLGSANETSWTYFDPNIARINPTQIQFDPSGHLWISQFSANRMDSFDPATNVLTTYSGFLAPLHFDLFGGRVYVSEAPSDKGRVVILDPAVAFAAPLTLNPQTVPVVSILNARPAAIRDTTAIVTTFTSTKATAADADVITTSPVPGLLRTQIPEINMYGINASAAGVWAGTEGKLVHIVPQAIGTASDLTVPLAAQFGVGSGQRIRIETTLVNRGTSAVVGDALYLYSPGSFAPRTTFTVQPGQTLVLPDTFTDASTNFGAEFGPVRIRITSGSASDIVASVRSAVMRDDGSSYGFSMPALAAADLIGQGSSSTLFTGFRDSETSILGVYSPAGAVITLTLVAPDGTVRGTLPLTLSANGLQEFNPAASAFGVSAESGDVVRIAVASGAIQPYMNVFDTGSGDVAAESPSVAATDGAFPGVTNRATGDGAVVSDLFLSNPNASSAANVSLRFTPSGGGAAKTAAVVLPAGASRAISDVLTSLFSTSGDGAVSFTSDAPISAAVRIAAPRPEGDYAAFASATSSSRALAGGNSADAPSPQTDARQTDLVLYNGGDAGVATVIAYDGDGNETGRTPVALSAGASVRLPAVVSTLGTAGDNSHVRVQASPGLVLYAAVEQIDHGTGDVEILRLR